MNWQKKQKLQRHRNLELWMQKKAKEGKPPAPVAKRAPNINAEEIIARVKKATLAMWQFNSAGQLVPANGAAKEKEHKHNKKVGPQHYEKLIARIEKRGLKRLGSGYFSRVFEHPDPDKVIKIIRNPSSDGWVDYVRWANEQGYGGTLAPKLISYKYIKNGGFGVAVMERLPNTLSDISMRYEKKHAATKPFNDRVTFLAKAVKMGFHANETALAYAELMQPGWRKFLEEFTLKFPSSYDMHDANWMVRPSGLIVMTDPLSHCGSTTYTDRFKAPRALPDPEPEPQFEEEHYSLDHDF